MKLVLKKAIHEKPGLLGKSRTFSLVAKVELAGKEQEAVHQFRLENILLYKADDTMGGVKQFASDNAMSNPLWRLIPKPPTITINSEHLLMGMTFENDSMTALMFIESEVKKAANRFHEIVSHSLSFLGEEKLELPVV